MRIQTFVVGMLQVNCYVLIDEETKECIMVDPGDEPDRLLDFIMKDNLDLRYIVCTHGHFDHIGAIKDIKNQLPSAKILLHKDEVVVYKKSFEIGRQWGFDVDEPPDADVLIEEGFDICFGNQTIKTIHTPGHSPGGICLIGKDFVITGDTLFAGSIGRTDLPGGDYSLIGRSYKRLMQLGDDMKVMPGHGPVSYIGIEKRSNPFSSEFL
ncbi:MAG: MBL fold metallo-hydrolase [Thermodesulfovibrionales bacterium]|nr:MBL fold metallo-hydrolase [Thermodesulfovibrionales bacterium]